MKIYQCYRLSNLEFRGEKYITIRKEGTIIEDIPDMTNVTNEEYPEPEDPSVKIIGVESVSSFKSWEWHSTKGLNLELTHMSCDRKSHSVTCAFYVLYACEESDYSTPMDEAGPSRMDLYTTGNFSGSESETESPLLPSVMAL